MTMKRWAWDRKRIKEARMATSRGGVKAKKTLQKEERTRNQKDRALKRKLG